jgi:hypothetical protein
MSKEINDRMFQLCRETSAMLVELYISYNSYRKEWSGSYLEREMEEQFAHIRRKDSCENLGELVGKMYETYNNLNDICCKMKSAAIQDLRDNIITQEEYKAYLSLILSNVHHV